MVTEQPRMSRLPGFLVVGLSLIAILGVGCKQGEGERCEQNSDCASGLQCSRTEVSAEAGRCEVPNTGQADASSGDNDAGAVDDDAGSDAGDDAAGTDAADDATGDAPTTSDAADAPADMSMPSDAATSDAASDAAAD